MQEASAPSPCPLPAGDYTALNELRVAEFVFERLGQGGGFGGLFLGSLRSSLHPQFLFLRTEYKANKSESESDLSRYGTKPRRNNGVQSVRNCGKKDIALKLWTPHRQRQ